MKGAERSSVGPSLSDDVGPGGEIGSDERREAERRTGAPLDGVRVHEDERGQAAAVRMGAHALASGDHVYLGPTVGTRFGPDRNTALLHELAHVAQSRLGREGTGYAPEDALEGEAEQRVRQDDGGSVEHAADPSRAYGFWGLFEDEEESSSSSSDSDSSRFGMQRTIWAHIEEAYTGIGEVGPIDAYDAAFGEDAEAASDLGSQFEDPWDVNAARHGVWQARLAHKHGAEPAEALGDAHEEGSPDALDSWIDQYNNRVARGIGESAGSTDEIPYLIRDAIEEGRLITDPTDARIPEELRRRGP